MESVKTKGRELFFEQLPEIEKTVRRIAARHRLKVEERQDLYSLTILRLVEDDFAALRAFQGRSRWSTYLAAVVQRIQLDERNRELGRHRPSRATIRLGPAAVALDACINREGMSPDEAVRQLLLQGLEAEPEELHRLARKIPVRPRRRFVPVEKATEVEVSPRATRGEQSLLSAEVREALVAAVRELPEPERRLLALRFERSWTVRLIADHLDTKPKPLYRRFEGIFRRLRRRLEAAGFEWQDVASAVESGLDGQVFT